MRTLIMAASLALVILARADFVPATLVRVIDGDTADLKVGEVIYRCRLSGVDAPEKWTPDGKEAAKVLDKLLRFSPVSVEVGAKDRYSRYSARVKAGNNDVAESMARGGYAWTYMLHALKDPGRAAELTAAELDAKLHRRHIWKVDNPVPPWVQRHPVKPKP